MIANKSKFMTGSALMISFAAVFVAIFMPLINGQNGLEYLDNLYNSISKGSAYYIDSVRTEVPSIQEGQATLNLTLGSERQAEMAVPLLEKAGAQITQNGASLTVTGNIISILNLSLDDAQLMYDNKGDEVSAKYEYHEKTVLYNWWSVLKAMEFNLKQQKRFLAAKITERVKKKAIETSYNYYGIEGQKITDRIGIVIFSLIFYVVYTLWYGFGIMYLFEGLGMQLEH